MRIEPQPGVIYLHLIILHNIYYRTLYNEQMFDKTELPWYT